jgi:pimeloyl-ACP methyl ester carboxylesterase
MIREVGTADGRTLTVRETGDLQGVPVFSLHGTPGSSLPYEPHDRVAEQEGIRLIRYDRPGYGGSSRRQGRDAAAWAEDVAAIADALGADRFCVWGISGGGPHALAAAALLPDRVAAAAALASVAPFDAEGLDFLAGMGERNAADWTICLESDERHLEVLERDRSDMLNTTPEEFLVAFESLLCPVDLVVASSVLAGHIIASTRAGVGERLDGWFDDDLVGCLPWGFDVASISVPVLVWSGEQDQFVPVAHGRWLAEHIPGAEGRFTPEDGHLTIGQRRIPDVHAWLLDHFD